MRISFYSVWVFCVSIAAYSGAVNAEQSSLEKYLTNECHYGGNFEQVRRVASVPVPLASRGRFLYACDSGLIWQTLHPIQQTIIYTVNQRHFEINSKGQIKRLKGIVHHNMAQLLMALLRGESAPVTDLFFVAADTTETNSIALTSRRAAIRKHLEKITLRKNSDALAITLINSADENTKIMTSDLNQYTSINLVQCEQIFDSVVQACEALLLPQLVEESLAPER